jgi:hypothetical protein
LNEDFDFIEIRNTYGIVIYTSLNKNLAEHKNIDISGYASGMYYLTMYKGNNKKCSKIVMY